MRDAIPSLSRMTALPANQCGSAGGSCPQIVTAALACANPAPGLAWIDIGCGTGQLLREVRDRHAPASLTGVDVLPWLDEDLIGDVRLLTGAAETLLTDLEPADRVLLVETIEHLTSPWDVLSAASALVAPGGWIVVTTPHVANLRHRLELAARGTLTSFRSDNTPHLQPALPHVIRGVLERAGLADIRVSFAGPDVIPLTGGRIWPAAVARRWPGLCSVSVMLAARRPRS